MQTRIGALIMNQVIKKASYVLGCLPQHGDDGVMENNSHPKQDNPTALRSSVSDRLLHPMCVKERYCRSVLPAAVRLYDQQCAISV